MCEVNNTFGERHCYLLAHDDGRSLAWGEEVSARKVFHVSPFCAVDGRYRFRFMLTGRGDARASSVASTTTPAMDRCCRRRCPARSSR